MINVLRAETLKLARPRVLISAVVAAVAFAVAAAAGVVLTASSESDQTGRLPTVAELSEAGGATEPFAIGASFAGLLVFLVFTANIANEHSRHTFRSLLLQRPQRLQILAGKMLALLGFAAVAWLVAAVVSAAAARLLAPGRDIATADWFTTAGLTDAASDYGTVMFITIAWALYGLVLATAVRSLPIAVGIGVAWAGPFEHLIGEAWTPGLRWFPGLLLEAVAANGTPDVDVTPAIATSIAYAVVAAVVAATIFRRRDIAT